MNGIYDPGNARMSLAADIIENTAENLFLTGKGGTGKTTFLRRLMASTSKRAVVLAPTGIAAVNAGGVTIHSFLQLQLAPFLPGHTATGDSKRRYDRFSRDKMRVIKTMDLMIIDEVSMVRADLLDAVDQSLRRHRNPHLPFGGVQLLLIGDLMQLAPVVKPEEWAMLSPYYSTPYFFSSNALREAGFQTVELTVSYRQTDSLFLDILNRVRDNRADITTLQALNSRYIPDFNPPDSEGYIRLTTHNESARAINAERLEALPGRAVTLEAKIEGEFAEYAFPAEKDLLLKKGARVMFLRNDPMQRYLNGTMGTVEAIGESSVTVRTIADPPLTVDIERATWENNKYTVNEQTAEITTETQGRFSQFPLRTAWAITVHKSQGLTFDRAIIDVNRSFAHGQTYVALSRCRSLDGLVLNAPLSPSSIINDPEVLRFASENAPINPGDPRIERMHREFAVTCFRSMFGMEALRRQFDELRRILDEYLHLSYPELCSRYGQASETLSSRIESVSERFVTSYSEVIRNSSGNSESPIPESAIGRINDACRYFANELQPFTTLVDDTPTKTDNKSITRRLAERRAELDDAIRIKLRLMQTFSDTRFSTSAYLETKAKASLEPPRKTITKADSTDTVPSTDIPNPALYNRLTEWRAAKAAEIGRPAFFVASTRSLLEIARSLPSSPAALGRIPGIGKAKLKAYGQEILEMVAEHS